MLVTVNYVARRQAFPPVCQRSIFLRLASIGAALFLVGNSLIAAETLTGQEGRLTLTHAGQIAFLRNWDLLAAQSDVDIAAAQRIVAREFPNPTLSLDVLKINVDNHAASTPEGNGFWERNYDSIAAVNQLFEIGGKRGARKQSAAAGFAGAEARFADARRTLESGVAQAYIGAVLAEEKRRVLRDSSVSLRREADIAATRRRAGDISLMDQSQIEITADRLALDAEQAESDARNARIALEVLLGEKDPKGNIELSDDLEKITARFATETNSMEASSPVRPDIVAAEKAREKAEADLRLQRSMRIPDPTVLAQYEHEPPDQPNTVGFGVAFPLPLWNRNRGNIAAAEATLRQAEVQLDKVRAQAVADVATTRGTFVSAANRWLRYRDELTPRARKIRESVSFAYEKGGASLLDLLSAQRNDNDVRLAAAQAAADTATAGAAFRAARAQQVIPASES